MSLLLRDQDKIEEGIKIGLEQGIKALIETCKELAISKSDTLSRIVEKFNLSKDDAEKILTKYWE